MENYTWIFVWVGIMAVALFIGFRLRKFRALTSAKYFMKDQNGTCLHILGSVRISPKNGDSYDIFEHYVFNTETKRFAKGEGQRGSTLDIESAFVERNLQFLSNKLGMPLQLDQQKSQQLLKIYYLDKYYSDTQKAPEFNNDCVIFIDLKDEQDHFEMEVYRDRNKLSSHRFRGIPEYLNHDIYLPDKGWFCHLYYKQSSLKYGMALLIVNYHTGELVMDNFVQPSGKR